jgi:hypothetical protein
MATGNRTGFFDTTLAVLNGVAGVISSAAATLKPAKNGSTIVDRSKSLNVFT